MGILIREDINHENALYSHRHSRKRQHFRNERSINDDISFQTTVSRVEPRKAAIRQL